MTARHGLIIVLQVKSPEDLEDPDKTFKPEMSNQIYGDNENIFGYKGLAVNLFMTAGGLQTYLGHSYKEKVDPSKTDGVTADDVISPLVKILAPDSFTDSKEAFLEQLTSDQEQNFRLVPGNFLFSSSKLQSQTYGGVGGHHQHGRPQLRGLQVPGVHPEVQGLPRAAPGLDSLLH